MLAAPALWDGCNGLRMRSLKSGRLQPSDPHTPSCATASGANSTHPSPSARQFRLPFNKLAYMSQGPLPTVMSSTQSSKRRLWGQRLLDEMERSNHQVGLKIVGECLPQERNRVTLTDKKTTLLDHSSGDLFIL